MRKVDVIVIGAGPAGAISAAKLRKEGFSVLVLEKMKFPRFVIGESLLPKCMNYLEELDLLPAIEAQGFQIKTGASFFHEDKVCDFLFSDKYTEGWDSAFQVKRADFDQVLINAVADKGVEVEYNATVTNVVPGLTKQVVTYTNKEGVSSSIESRFVVDASGYGRVLPRMFGLDSPVDSIKRGAVFSHITDTNKSEKASNNIFVHAFNDNKSWVWSIPFSDDTCSVGVVGDAEFVEKCAADDNLEFKRIIKQFPFMKERFSNSSLLFEPKKIINYATSVSKIYGDGYVLCGNATEFLDPIFSSGVTLAMASGYDSAALVAKQLKGETVDWEQDYAVKMNAGIDVFRSYVNAWYSGDLHTIIFASNIQDDYKKQICSVLAGYVWDKSNPFVKKHKTVLKTLAKVISIT